VGLGERGTTVGLPVKFVGDGTCWGDELLLLRVCSTTAAKFSTFDGDCLAFSELYDGLAAVTVSASTF